MPVMLIILSHLDLLTLGRLSESASMVFRRGMCMNKEHHFTFIDPPVGWLYNHTVTFQEKKAAKYITSPVQDYQAWKTPRCKIALELRIQMRPSSVKEKPPVVQPGAGNNIIVNPNQRLNPVLDCIRNVGKEFGDIVPDFQVGRTTCILFLSLRYHRLHPEYIHTRIAKLGLSYNVRILLIMCDVTEHQELIRELTKVCLINNLTVIVAWSNDEAGQYIATFKQFEHKPPDLIKERVDKDYESQLRTALTSINKVNKTDVETLRTSLGSFADISRASSDRLQTLPGFGQVKVKRIKDAFEKPFRNRSTSAAFSIGGRVPQVPHLDPSFPADSEPAASANDKGKEKETLPSFSSPDHRTREPSPVWDIELDLV